MKERRGYGKGSIKKRKDGRYEGVYRFHGKYISIYGISHEEIEEKLFSIQQDILKGIHKVYGMQTCGKWMLEWLFDYSKIGVSHSTWINYEHNIRRHVLPQLGDMQLTSITTSVLQKHISGLLQNEFDNPKGLSAKSIHNLCNIIHRALEQAVENRLLLHNPASAVKRPKIQHKEMRVLTKDEQQLILRTVARSGDPSLFGITFVFSTGLRLGELMGLQWRDVDIEAHSISVKRTLARQKKKGNSSEYAYGEKTHIVTGPLKTPNAYRSIPLFSDLWQDLMQYRREQLQFINQSSEGHLFDNQGFIFCNQQGKPIEPGMYGKKFKQLCQSIGLTDKTITFHTTRHTFATRAIESGMDVKVISSLLGHADVSTTLNMYGHALPAHKKESMDRMASFYYVEKQIDPNEILLENGWKII